MYEDFSPAEFRAQSDDCKRIELPAGEFDVLAVTASVPRIDERFVNALRPGGRLFLVVGEPPVMRALLITRDGDELREDDLFETNIPALENLVKEPIFSF